MKNPSTQVLVLFLFGLHFQHITIAQQNSNWLRNLSEGMGEDLKGFEDFSPEIASANSIVHTAWLTWKGSIQQFNYRRSADNGLNWDSKIELAEGVLDIDKRYKRMAVSGNYVHLVINRNTGSIRELVYLRSTNGGASFDEARILYSTTFSILNLQIEAEADNVRIFITEECHYCATKKWLYLIKSDDNGFSFENKLINEDVGGVYSQITGLKMDGQSIYLLYLKSIGYWANYDYELHLLSSVDGGNTFRDRIISEPAMSGQHHPFALLDGSNGYMPKIAADGKEVWVVWSGWDDQNSASVFVRHSSDGGLSFSSLKKVSGSVTNLHAGLETIAAKGKNVYIIFNTTNNKLFVNQSTDGGESWSGTVEFTRPTGYYLDWGIEPQLLIDPNDSGAFALSTGPKLGKLKPDGNTREASFYGLYSFGISRRPKMSLSDNYIHLIMEGGGEWKRTGDFTDVNIWYRRIQFGEIEPMEEELTVKMTVVPNQGDGTGINRFDNMIIEPGLGDSFKDALTIELWVKPDSINALKKIFTQYTRATWNTYNPVSFQLWATESDEPVAGILTSTGAYALPAGKKLLPGYWNHIAVSYANNDSAGNFRILLNGQLVNQVTAKGEFVQQDALWILGSIRDGYLSEGFNGSIDELRCWNVARTTEEIREFRFKQLNGDEPGLKAYYRFNSVSPFGEISDLSGNGYTGHLMCKEELPQSNISDIDVSFSFTQNSKSIFFQAFPIDGDDYTWNFGDGRTSGKVNPSHTFNNPGVFEVCLSVLKNVNSGVFCKNVTVLGLEKIVPNHGGNSGILSSYIYGGGLSKNSIVQLELNGAASILSENVYFNDQSANLIQAVFDLSNQEEGLYDVVVRDGTNELRLEKSFLVEKGIEADPFVTVSGPHKVLINRWTTYSVTVGNNSNIDAHGVPVWLAFTGDVDVSFVGLNVNTPEEIIDLGWGNFVDSIKLFNHFDTLFGKPMKGKLVSLYFPILPAKFSKTFSVRIKSLSDTPNQILAWNTPPLFASPLNDFAKQCMYEVLVYTVIKSGLEVLIPGSGCVFGGLELLLQFKDDLPPPPGGNTQAENFLMHLSTAAAECLTTWNPISSLGQKMIFSGSVSAELYYSYNDCKHGFRPLNLFTFFYYVLYSFDPNEKSGLSGYGDENYIGAINSASYQINFENKSTATAPAQEVLIIDTLDSRYFDLESFSFGAVGFGDSIYYPGSGSFEFAMDIDRRPTKNHIVRISGKLDTSSRIITWLFKTLDPQSYDLPEDALGGFLPPNINSPEGEGFVNFTIGLKDIAHKKSFRNKAHIIFDNNAPIITNDYLNTFDLRQPESFLSGIEGSTEDTLLQIEILGEDDGGGIREFEIFVSENDNPFELAGTAFSSPYIFSAENGNTYSFYSIAMDNVGNREEPPAYPDLEISVLTNTKELEYLSDIRIYPQPASSEVILEFNLLKGTSLSFELLDLRGQLLRHMYASEYPEGSTRLPLSLALPPGMYFLKITDGRTHRMEKLMVF